MCCQLNSCRTRVFPSLPPRGLQIPTLLQSLELPSILQNVLWKYPNEIVRYAPLWYVICMGKGGELGFYMRSENSSLAAYVKTELLQWQDAKHFGQRNYNEDIFSPWEQLCTLKHFPTQLSTKSGLWGIERNWNIHKWCSFPKYTHISVVEKIFELKSVNCITYISALYFIKYRAILEIWYLVSWPKIFRLIWPLKYS